jgi:hypothetical protein
MIVRRSSPLELIPIPPNSDLELRFDDTFHHCEKTTMKVISSNMRIVM